MQILAIIPARGGSKGVYKKNIRQLGNVPLIQYSIDAAKSSTHITDIVISTDDSEIASIGKNAGIEVIKRPESLARDESLVMDAVRHVIETKLKQGIEFDILVLLEPTAPFRTADDIDKTIQILLNQAADSAATFSETETPPTRIWKIKNHRPIPFIKGADPFLPRQHHEKGFALNGMVYVLKIEQLHKNPKSNSFLLGKTVAHIIPKERVVDIDTETDFFFAEQMLKHITVIYNDKKNSK